MIFEPGYFRTEVLTMDNRAAYGGSISDYEPVVRAREDALTGK